MDQTTAVVLAAGIGAGGAVAGQVISAYFTQRSASKRFAWERGGRFADVKRELFARFLAAHWAFYWEDLSFVPANPTTEDRDRIQKAYTEKIHATGVLIQEIALVAPAVKAACSDLTSAAGAALIAAEDGAGGVALAGAGSLEPSPALRAYLAAMDECKTAMSKDIDATA